MTKLPDFAAYCECACRKHWGEPTRKTTKMLKWGVGDYGWRSYDTQKRVWYDSESERGGSTLELAALALGLPADTKIEGELFNRCWLYAHEHSWGVDPPPIRPKPSKKRRVAAPVAPNHGRPSSRAMFIGRRMGRRISKYAAPKPRHFLRTSGTARCG